MSSTILSFQPPDEILAEVNSVFNIFYKYWYVCSSWSLAEIKQICLVLDICCDHLDPNNFLDKKTAYIFHIQNCFRLRVI